MGYIKGPDNVSRFFTKLGQCMDCEQFVPKDQQPMHTCTRIETGTSYYYRLRKDEPESKQPLMMPIDTLKMLQNAKKKPKHQNYSRKV